MTDQRLKERRFDTGWPWHVRNYFPQKDDTLVTINCGTQLYPYALTPLTPMYVRSHLSFVELSWLRYLVPLYAHRADGKNFSAPASLADALECLPLLHQSAECVTYGFVHLRPIDQAKALAVVIPGRGIRGFSFS